jgi:hypothetical protein
MGRAGFLGALFGAVAALDMGKAAPGCWRFEFLATGYDPADQGTARIPSCTAMTRKLDLENAMERLVGLE